MSGDPEALPLIEEQAASTSNLAVATSDRTTHDGSPNNGSHHERVNLEFKHYTAIGAVGWIFAVGYFTNTMLNVAFELPWTENSTIFGHQHHPHQLLLHFMDARLFAASGASFIGTLVVPFLHRHLLKLFQTSCLIVTLAGVVNLTPIVYDLTLPAQPLESSDDCVLCGLFFASEFLLGIGVALGSGVGVAFLFHMSRSKMDLCVKLVGSLAICILFGELLGFSCSFIFEDKAWLFAIGIVESLTVVALVVSCFLSGKSQHAPSHVEVGRYREDDDARERIRRVHVQQDQPPADDRAQQPSTLHNFDELMAAFHRFTSPPWQIRVPITILIVFYTMLIGTLYASIDIPRFMWSLVADDIFDDIGEEKSLAKLYAIIADVVAIVCCIVSVLCNTRLSCCHGASCQATKLCIFSSLGFSCFLVMWLFEVGPLKTTHHIAWPVIVYAPLGALCMEAFLELLPIMVPASIFTSVVMQAVFWRSFLFLTRQRSFPEQLKHGKTIVLGVIALSALSTCILSLQCLYKCLDGMAGITLYRMRKRLEAMRREAALRNQEMNAGSGLRRVQSAPILTTLAGTNDTALTIAETRDVT